MSIQPDWEAWNRLAPEERAARIQRYMAAHGHPMSDTAAREVAERYMADRQGKRERLQGRSDEERLLAAQGRHREELAAMDRERTPQRAGRTR